MAVQFKANPRQLNVARHFNGKSLTAVTITASNAGDLLAAGADGAVLGPNGAFQKIITSITDYATPIVISAIRNDRVFDVYFEGEFGTDNYGTRAQAPRTFAAYLEERIKTIGVVDGINMGNASVALMTPSHYQADQINATGVPYTNAQ